MKVLISPVGKRDPWGAASVGRPAPITYGAAVSTALAVRPDVVFLLPTIDRLDIGAEHTMAEAAATAAVLSDILPSARVCLRAYNVGDPTDYTQVLPETERLLRAIMSELGDDPPVEVVLNVSSGTPQIQASLQLAASVGLVPAIVVQSRDPRFVRSGEEQVREVPARFWSEAFARDRARRLFERNEFEACAVELEFLCGSPQSQRRATAGNLHRLCILCGRVQHIDYTAASKMADELLVAVTGTAEYAAALPLLEAQAALLRRLPKVHPKQRPGATGHAETQELLADIYHNAVRCYDLRYYADSLARVWRVLEGALFMRLRERHHVEPNDLRSSPDQEAAAKVITFMGKERECGEVKITLGSAERVLNECLCDAEFGAVLRSPFPGQQRRVGQVVNRLREARNASVVGHNALPVAEETAREGLNLAKLMLTALTSGPDLDGHPFAPAAIAAVGKSFFDALHV